MGATESRLTSWIMPMNSEKAQLSWLRTLLRKLAAISLSCLRSSAMCLCSRSDGQGSKPITRGGKTIHQSPFIGIPFVFCFNSLSQDTQCTSFPQVPLNSSVSKREMFLCLYNYSVAFYDSTSVENGIDSCLFCNVYKLPWQWRNKYRSYTLHCVQQQVCCKRCLWHCAIASAMVAGSTTPLRN